jgi:hypothetical protein
MECTNNVFTTSTILSRETPLRECGFWLDKMKVSVRAYAYAYAEIRPANYAKHMSLIL